MAPPRFTCWIAAVLAMSPAVARAEGDMSEALRFAQGVMGDTAADGYEELIDSDPDEALAMLLARDVVPGRAPEAYLQEDANELGLRPTENVLESLGDTRLNYGALRAFIVEAAQATRLPAALIDAVIRTESGYRPHAVSNKGARGLMQLLPSTARMMGVENTFDPRDNILGGSRYLAKLLARFGSLRLAIAAYNAGPEAVDKHGSVPPYLETIRYVNTVMSRFQNARHRD
jgi:soluble lytic murein transglycosylase-like protein